MGPTKDTYTIGDNPQYKLSIGPGNASVWVLLTRHITSIEDFRENKEYITLLVYANNGKRVYYPRKQTISKLLVIDRFNLSFFLQTIHIRTLTEYESIVHIICAKYG